MSRNQTKQERKVFQQIIEQYMEMKSTHGTSSCSGFYRGLAKEGGRTGFNMRVVTVGPSDFIADVELSARRALSSDEALHAVFVEAYVKGHGPEIFKDEAIERVEQAVGRMLIERRIHPTELYFKARDLR